MAKSAASMPAIVVLLAFLCSDLLGVGSAAAEQGVEGSKTRVAIREVTRGGADLTAPPNVPPGLVRRYGLVFPFQVAPRMAALSLNLRVEGVAIGDFEDGADIVLFDDLQRIQADGATPLTRNEALTDPQTGQKRYVVKFPVIGGFVPLGARRADGAPHPYAGFGFGICQALDFPATATGHFSWKDRWRQNLEVRQFAYDGRRFHTVRSELWTEDKPLRPAGAEWVLLAPGLTWGIPDGDDILFALTASKDGIRSAGVSRWVRRSGVWAPEAFTPITEAADKGTWYEPSLVRDTDGALLFSARLDQPVICVWRASDAGGAWRKVVDVRGERQPAPVTLNRAADGTPYVAANQFGRGREVVCLWPLTPARTGLELRVLARDARADFGPPASGRTWKVDHPNAAVLRLADGKWRNVLAYRIMDAAEHAAAAPPPQTGCYVEEVLSDGPAVPAWRFESDGD